MSKSLFLIVFMLVTGFCVQSQPIATQGTVEYQKGPKPAAIIEVAYAPSIVEDAIKEYMAKKGFKQETSKGFQVYKGARLSATAAELSDLYFKVDRKSRQDKNISVVYMIVGRPNENVALKAADDNNNLEDGKTFLTELVPSVEAHNLEVSISDQEETIKKAEKKLRSLQDDQKDYEKKLRNLEDKLAENKRDQETQNAEVSTQRSVRDAMIGRRKL
jgi:chromosome segregation ATPase